VKKQKCVSGVCMLSKGVASRFDPENLGQSEKQLAENMNAMQHAFEVLGVSEQWLFDFPDNQFDSVALLDIIKAVESAVVEFDPDVIFTHHHEDLNIDHRLVAQAVLTAVRPTGPRKRQVLTFETPSSSEWQIPSSDKAFIPTLFFELTAEDIAAKTKAIGCYKNEIREYPHPRSTKALEIIAQRWGTVAGFNYAEAFNVLRWYETIDAS
jgi:LmbE family N-acetylglucosaminyl deacetylase